VLRGYRWHVFARIWRTPVLGELFQLTTTRPTFRAFLNEGNSRPFPEEFLERTYADIGAEGLLSWIAFWTIARPAYYVAQSGR
jgi:hypothetical protein